jgi:hypothetical protein
MFGRFSLREYITIPFSDDLTKTALEQAQGSTVFVFPTHVSASRARHEFMRKWALQECDFITMQEFKESLLLPSEPVVSDDRRMLCLYQALSSEHREYFHINGFFDIVEWGNQFFQFFEELCDENLDVETLRNSQSLNHFNLLEWQENYLSKVLEIRANYQELLCKLGFSDPIFFQNKDKTNIVHTGIRYVFVNQYYYSKLEKSLIEAVEAAGNEIIIISQMLEAAEKGLTPSEIDLQDLEPETYRLRNLEVLEFKNADQSVLYFLSNHALNEEEAADSVLVDSHFNRASYRHLFDPRRFAMSEKQSIQTSGIYKMFNMFRQHLDAMRGTLDESFLPLRLILDACSQEVFLNFYGLQNSQKNSLLEEIKVLLKSDILYVDTKLKLFDKFESPRGFKLLRSVLEPHLALLNKLSGIGSPQDLVDLLDTPGGIEIKSLCSEVELQNSDILEVFYSRLANFASLEKLGLVQDWAKLFDCEGTKLAVSVLQLFLESLGGCRISFDGLNRKADRFQISNLLDLRNLSYDHVYFFHAIEGELPSSPNPVWLLNEAQRAKLNLKSYSDLRQRERYYFLRTVLSSQHCVIFTHRNLENDIEPGSFVTELIQACQDGALSQVKLENKKYEPRISSLYQAWLGKYDKEETPWQNEVCRDFGEDFQRFFTIPSLPDSDLGKNRDIVSGHYGLDGLQKNPFTWYIKHLRRLPELELRPDETITRKLLGAIMHDFLSGVLQPLAGRDLRLRDIEPYLTDEIFLADVLHKLFSGGGLFYRYKIPQNYNYEFLTSIISSSMVDSIKQFYQDFLAHNLKNTPFRLIPEQDNENEGGNTGKELLRINMEGADYVLRIRGRADLRVKCTDQDIIIDFKTGGLNYDQLYFYEWLYYRLDENWENRKLVSLFWQLFKYEMEKSSDKPEARIKWKDQVEDVLRDCLAEGYSLGQKVADRQDLKKISRADLYRTRKGGGK